MNDPQTPNEHLQFDSLCADVEDYETLPEVVPGQAEMVLVSAGSVRESIDAEILAGLVLP